MDFFTGQILPMAISYAPKQTAACNGQTIPTTQNQALFALLGYTFGGSGTAFAIPNLQGRSTQGIGRAGAALPLGAIGGETSHALQLGEMPQHIHTVAASTQGSVGSSPGGNLPGVSTLPIYGPAPASPTPLGAAPFSTTGSGQPHQNMQPSLAVTMAIVLYGIFPSRG